MCSNAVHSSLNIDQKSEALPHFFLLKVYDQSAMRLNDLFSLLFDRNLMPRINCMRF